MRGNIFIRGARIVDGTGVAEREGDVLVQGDRISAIGNLPREVEAETILDASGKVVAPGFIDIHSHGDLVLAWPSDTRLPLVEGRLAQGITTEIVGNCGLGVAPLFGHATSLLPELNGWMTPAAFSWAWADVDGYLSHLESIGLPVNVGTLVAHGPLRLGAHALAPGETEAKTRRAMEEALDEALEQGAFGLSAGLIYPPGMYASTDELICLARRVARRDRAFTCHVRGSSETLLDAVGELIQVGRDAEVKVHHSHTEAVGESHFPKLARALEMEDEARAQGIRLTADMFPYPVAATMMLAIFPPWSLEGGLARLVHRLKDHVTRARIRSDIETLVPEWPPWREGGWPHNLVKAVGWDRIRVSSVSSGRSRSCEGMTLEELGRDRGQDPFDAIADLMIEEEGNVGQLVGDISGDEGLDVLIGRPDVAFVTDANDYGRGKPHPAAYGSFPRVLARYVRERRMLGLPEAIRRMTSLPAEILGISNRGRIEEGAFADLVIFDPNAIEDRASIVHPRHKAAGVEAVLVNGRIAYREGALTGSLPGTALRRI